MGVTQHDTIGLSNLYDACQTDIKGLEYIKKHIDLYVRPELSVDMKTNIEAALSGLRGVAYNCKMLLDQYEPDSQ